MKIYVIIISYFKSNSPWDRETGGDSLFAKFFEAFDGERMKGETSPAWKKLVPLNRQNYLFQFSSIED